MKTKDLRALGIASPAARKAANAGMRSAADAGFSRAAIREVLAAVAERPEDHLEDEHFAELAAVLASGGGRRAAREAEHGAAALGGSEAPWRQWGEDLDPQSVEQMRNACRLPIAVRGALMPDAHVGYGLPIGGVLAARNAVIPYAVGVDIACRMKMSVLDLPLAALEERTDRLRAALADETRFGIGAKFKDRRRHPVMDEDWSISPVTSKEKDKAWAQLGTSGSGNHFVEFGELEVFDAGIGLAPGRYLALLSHSGSRGVGNSVASHYSRVARSRCRGLPRELEHLAWLDLDSGAGQEYWAAMELMGRYAAANHALVHAHVREHLGAAALLDVENHHNFAWEERHFGEDLIVHRKGATPASAGTVGIIPGSMAAPGYVVRGLGSADSLHSAAHGAGRRISRKKAKALFDWAEAQRILKERRVMLMSAGLDEVPMAYKDIEQVMAAQTDLVEPLARFLPRLVRMAPAGERPED